MIAASQEVQQLLDKMIAGKQLSASDARHLAAESAESGNGAISTEEDVLKWLAKEYGLTYTTLEDVEPDRQLLSLFPARILLKEELLPLKRNNGTVEIATSRLFATGGLDALKTITGLKLRPVLASTEAIQREMKKRLGVGADTIGTLGEEGSFQVVDDNPEEDTNLDSAAEDASIIRFVNQVLRDAIELRAPASVSLGHAFLQPGEWGRFEGLPCRKDVVEGLSPLTVLQSRKAFEPRRTPTRTSPETECAAMLPW